MSDAYRDAGVNVEAGNELVDRIKPALNKNQTPDLLRGLRGFAALCKVPGNYEHPVMALGTDGVGTKLDLLTQYGRLDTVGQDLVAMCVNDVIVYGATPSLFLDYYATGKLAVDEAETVIKSIAAACDLAGCALVGGETAEMPGFYPPGKFDLAGFCIGWVEERDILYPASVQANDVIIGLASSGPHSNGYSLIRQLLSRLKTPPETLTDLLTPTRIYANSVIGLASRMRTMAHITGGGFKDNLPRAFSAHLEAHIELKAWPRPNVFQWLQTQLAMDELDMLKTFNCGIGMALFVAPDHVDALLAELTRAGEQAFVIGKVHERASDCQHGTLIVATDRFEIV